jgi:hypothetical protein
MMDEKVEPADAHQQERELEQATMEPAEAHAREALNLVYGDRQADYGHPYDDYSRTVGAFNALTGHELSVLEGGLFMVLVKLSRQMNRPKADNMVDAHGYLLVMDRIQDRLAGFDAETSNNPFPPVRDRDAVAPGKQQPSDQGC